MRLEHLPQRLDKLSKQQGLTYALGRPATEADVLRAEQRFGVSFPAQVRQFYKHVDGLRVMEPQLEVLALAQLCHVAPNRLHFATFDGQTQVSFDVSQTNAADQWDIVSDEDYRITMTMASFWSNKIWAWLEKGRAIWKEWQPDES